MEIDGNTAALNRHEEKQYKLDTTPVTDLDMDLVCDQVDLMFGEDNSTYVDLAQSIVMDMITNPDDTEDYKRRWMEFGVSLALNARTFARELQDFLESAA